jgi:two-component system, LytTR family, sensor kinase
VKQVVAYNNIVFRNLVVFTSIFTLILLIDKFSPHIPGLPHPTLVQVFTYYCVNYAIVFIHNHFNIRCNFLPKRLAVFALISVAIIIAFAFVSRFFSIQYKMPTNNYSDVLSSIMTLFVGALLYLAHLWIKNNYITAQKDLASKVLELNFLKQQLSPHFLLNALNNLYGVALAEPKNMPDKILELSSLLNYQVSAVNKEHVPLSEELSFVNSYLQHAQYKSHNLLVKQTKIGAEPSIEIPPLLYLPLIENAVKYSAESEQPLVQLEWTFDAKRIALSIENSVVEGKSKASGNQIGFLNLKRRLEIIELQSEFTSGPTNHNTYKAQLVIWHKSLNA